MHQCVGLKRQFRGQRYSPNVPRMGALSLELWSWEQKSQLKVLLIAIIRQRESQPEPSVQGDKEPSDVQVNYCLLKNVTLGGRRLSASRRIHVVTGPRNVKKNNKTTISQSLDYVLRGAPNSSTVYLPCSFPLFLLLYISLILGGVYLL